ncbi:MAG: bile acid:sodium symporter family protein [Bacteroidota bacterium]
MNLKVFFWIALVCLVLALVFYLTGQTSLTGPFIIAFFVLLALSAPGIKQIKGFAFALWIFSSVSAAMFYPVLFRSWGSFDLKILIVPLLQIIMFGMGSQMSIKDFQGVIKMPKGVIVGIVCQFTIMPIIGITIASTFGFPPEIAAGIVLVGSSPSGLASNVMAFLSKANLALSVTLTAVATLMAPIMTPLLMKLFAGQYVPIDFWNMMIGITEIVILPIIGGLMFNAIAYGKHSRKSIIIQAVCFFLIVVLKNVMVFETSEAGLSAALIEMGKNTIWFVILPIIAGFQFKKWAASQESLNKALSFISMAGIAVIISIITAAGRDSLLEIGALLILACLIHNTFGYFLGYWACRLLGMDERSCRTIAIEVGMQNGGLASGIALQMGKVATVGLAPAVFGPMMNITGSTLASWWRDRPPVGDDETKTENE